MNSNKKNVILTGSRGFLGKILVKELLKKGYIVYEILRPQKKYLHYDDRNVIPVYSELNDLERLKNIFENLVIDCIFHLAWSGSRGLNRDDYSIQLKNLNDSNELFSIAEKIGVRRFIMTGTISEQLIEQFSINSQIKLTYYAMFKFFSRLSLLKKSIESKTDFVWAQLSNLFGREDNSDNIIPYTVECMLQNKTAYFSKADQLYDFLNVDDAAKALILISESILSKKFYYIGSGNPRILRKFLEAIAIAFNRKELLNFEERPSEGYRYNREWFSINDLIKDCNFYPDVNFEDYFLNWKSQN